MAVVYLKCTREPVPVEQVHFLDIEEDIQGADVMTFECPECGEEHKSRVYG